MREMHTPRLVGLPGQEPHFEPFWTEVTQHATRNTQHPVALITSPEYAMKRPLAEGMGKDIRPRTIFATTNRGTGRTIRNFDA